MPGAAIMRGFSSIEFQVMSRRSRSRSVFHLDSECISSHETSQYFAACRLRIPAFIQAHYAWPGALGLNRQAFGRDILVAPFNFLMGFPNFVLQLLSLLLNLFGAQRLSARLAGIHLGLPTRVQEVLRERVLRELLDLPSSCQPCPGFASGSGSGPGSGSGSIRQQVRVAAEQPLSTYIRTRNVAADITAGTLAAIMGLLILSQFTPGSISVGTTLAKLLAHQQAAADFFLGETLGRLYYGVFPVSPSLFILGLVMLGVIAVIAVVAAFSGLLHDPLQTATGIHRRRLEQMLDAIERSCDDADAEIYRPRDSFYGRIYDAIDWLKGLLSF